MPGLTIGDTVPNLELDSTHGKIRIHDYVGDGYAIIFSHPGTIRSLGHMLACTHIMSISVLMHVMTQQPTSRRCARRRWRRWRGTPRSSRSVA